MKNYKVEFRYYLNDNLLERSKRTLRDVGKFIHKYDKKADKTRKDFIFKFLNRDIEISLPGYYIEIRRYPFTINKVREEKIKVVELHATKRVVQMDSFISRWKNKGFCSVEENIIPYSEFIGVIVKE